MTPALRFAARLLAVGTLLLFADALVWGHTPGPGLAVWLAATAVCLAGVRPRTATRPGALLLAALFLASLVATACEPGLTNACAVIGLGLAWVGNLDHPTLPGLWARTAEATSRAVLAPGRWLALVSDGVDLLPGSACLPGTTRSVLRWTGIAFPTLVLLPVFATLLLSGNAILWHAASEGILRVWDWIITLALTPERALFWMVVATGLLALFHPRRTPDSPRWWTRVPAGFGAPTDPVGARWRSVLLLAALNLLFLAATTTDALYLWMNTRLPDGVSASAFLHRGTASLILAVVLSGLVLTLTFAQDRSLTTRRDLRCLGLAWIVQNLVLAAGVLLRLKLYVDQFQLTPKRIYVALFVGLVATGCLLLAWYVLRGESPGWLIGRNAVAVLALFGVVQFLDVNGFVAKHNTRRYLRHERVAFDRDYLAALGPTAWPWLARLDDAGRREAVQLAAAWLAVHGPDWRGRPLRPAHACLALLREHQPTPEHP